MIKTDQQFRKWILKSREFLENKGISNEELVKFIRENCFWTFFEDIDEFIKTHSDEELMEILNK